MTDEKNTRAPRIQAAIDLVAAGHTLQPNDKQDRRAIAHIASILRRDEYLPLETVILSEEPKVIGYRLPESELLAYHNNRDAQIKRVKGAIQRSTDIRDARHVVEFFARRGKEVPDWVQALAKQELETAAD